MVGRGQIGVPCKLFFGERERVKHLLEVVFILCVTVAFSSLIVLLAAFVGHL